jgi:antitoxin component YwqK of YwqJK toxin-antitoxin module
MKNYKFYIVLFLFFSAQIIVAQSAFNKLDQDGKKEGIWKGYYADSKRLRYDGTFKHGKEVGVFSFYDDTKTASIIATREFNALDDSAYTIFYDQAKNKVSEGKVINKLFDGQWKYYHQASKVIMTVEYYKNGKLEGVRSVFYPSGKIAEEINYKNNLKEGVYKSFSENGTVLEESHYKNNEYNGLATFRDPQGNLVSKGSFLNGKKYGNWQFFANGKEVQLINMSAPQNASKAKQN